MKSKSLIKRAGKETNADVVITEIGGSVGDIESLPYLRSTSSDENGSWEK